MPLTRAGQYRRHPHQLLIALILIVVGLPLLLGGPQIGTLPAMMPRPLVYVWSATFAFGGAGVVIAGLVRSVMTALYIELTADLPIALTALTYAIAVTLVKPSEAGPVWVIYGAMTVAFVVRWAQVFRTVHTVRRTLEDHLR